MLKNLANILESNADSLESWYQDKLSQGQRCIYSSIDLRYSGHKLVPVDVNLFPAGFNNFTQDNIAKAAKILGAQLKQYNKILIIGENHTRNLHYLDNLQTLKTIITLAGYECQIGSLDATENVNYNGHLYSDIILNPLQKDNDNLKTLDGFTPDLILLNNDLMTGIPSILDNIEQKIMPHPNNGWFRRRKSYHFAIYNQLIQELEQLFNIPSSFLSSDFLVCDQINFKTGEGIDSLAQQVGELLLTIQKKYTQHNIPDQPYVVIKSDYGTYGMAIMIVKSADELYNLNQKHRRQMHITKNSIVNNQVILQEGIKTIDKINDAVAEPLLYLVDHQQIAFLHRIHKDKDEHSNLNAVGMEIVNNYPVDNDYRICCEFVTRIATLAASLELNA